MKEEILMQGHKSMRTWVGNLVIGLGSVVCLSGCVATESRMKDYVDSQLSSLSPQLRTQEGRLNQLDGRLKQTEAKVASLKLERETVGNLIDGVYFATGSDRLTDEARAAVDAFVDTLGDLQDVNFYVAGYADVRGTARYNYDLGEARATQVAKHLITRRGVLPARVITGSHGKSDPVAQTARTEEQALDRRVEVVAFKERIRTTAAN